MTAPCPPFPLPAEDRELSPYTGFTRAHWEAAADGLLTAAWRWASPGGARLDLPGRASAAGPCSDGLEGYARTFLAAAFRVAGAGGEDPHGWLGRYAEGLAAGTATPGGEDADSWPRIVDYQVFGQPMVESASVALGLHLTRPWLWDRLDPAVRDRAADWLRGAVVSTCPPSNWQFFPLTVATFLESVGRGDRDTERVVRRALDAIELWDQGEGWYTDGESGAFDHYNGWALHLYPVLHARLLGDGDLLAHFGGRLSEHLRTLTLTFDGNGAPLHLGRSLTYRFGAAAGVGLGAVTGHTPLSPGTSRRIMSGALRYFLERGAVDGDGLLSLGWHGPHRATLQRYSGPASPYWASKAFVSLLAGPGHPLWSEREGRAPAEEERPPTAVRAPGWLVQTTPGSGLVRVHQHGNAHPQPYAVARHAADPHYGRFAYSTRTGPTAGENVADNSFTVVLADGSTGIRIGGEPLGCGTEPGYGCGWAASAHTPVFAPGAPLPVNLRVESVTVVRGGWELRVHRVLHAPQGARLRLTGWATGPGEEITSVLRPLCGLTDAGRERAPEGTAFTRYAEVPRLDGPASGTLVVAALATLTDGEEARREETPEEVDDIVEVVRRDADGVEFRWTADGLLTRVSFAPVAVTSRRATDG